MNLNIVGLGTVLANGVCRLIFIEGLSLSILSVSAKGIVEAVPSNGRHFLPRLRAGAHDLSYLNAGSRAGVALAQQFSTVSRSTDSLIVGGVYQPTQSQSNSLSFMSGSAVNVKKRVVDIFDTLDIKGYSNDLFLRLYIEVQKHPYTIR